VLCAFTPNARYRNPAIESKKGKKVNLATADYISKEDFNQTPNMFPVLSLAVEILKECGFEEVEATSTRKRYK
jgi:hypothetical protein